MTAVENEIPDVSNLVKKKKKTDHDAEILKTKSNYFTTANLNKFTVKKLDLKIKQNG